MFESPAGFWFPQFGFKLVVLESGQPNGLYHAENQQEAFLLLSGECRLLMVGERSGNEQLRYPVSELAVDASGPRTGTAFPGPSRESAATRRTAWSSSPR